MVDRLNRSNNLIRRRVDPGGGKIKRLGLRVLLLEDPITATRILRPLVIVLVIGGILLGVLIEDDATEIVSVIVLLITSVICRRILDLRRPPGTPMFRGPTRIWALISLGFMFLALDEALSIHENLDRLFHYIMSIEETDLTDRIDDLLILVYAIIGAILIYLHRSEFKVLARQYGFLLIGFAFLCVGVLFDALGNRDDVVTAMGFNDPRAILELIDVAEEVSKLLAEAVFLFGFLRIYQSAYDERTASTEASAG